MLTHHARALVLSCGATLAGCAADAATLDTSREGPVPAAEAPARETFTVLLDRATTEQSVIPAIVAAGHDPLIAACKDAPDASVRIFDPLASGTYVDVPCAAILGIDEATGQATAALTSEVDGPLGQARQAWSLFGLVCSALTLGSGLVATYALCPRATNPRDETNCGHVANFGFGGLSFLCFLI